jgi:hypothetical protein
MRHPGRHGDRPELTGSLRNYSVKLSWDASSSSSEPIAGYNIFRA